MIKRGLNTVDRFVLVEHIIHIPPVRVGVELEAELTVAIQGTGLVPRFELAFLRPAVSVAARDGGVGFKCVSGGVIQVDLFSGDTDDVAGLEDEPIDDGIYDNLALVVGAQLNAMCHFQHNLLGKGKIRSIYG